MSERDNCEWDCEGCGVHVVAFGIELPPRHLLCSTCAWLCEYVPDPDEFWTTYQHMRERSG